MDSPKITTALEVAILAKCLPDINAAADLIQQYANTVAAGQKLEASIALRNRIFAKLEGGTGA